MDDDWAGTGTIQKLFDDLGCKHRTLLSLFHPIIIDADLSFICNELGTFVHEQVRVVGLGKDAHIKDILHGEAGLQLGGAEVDERLDVVSVAEGGELLEPGVLGAHLRGVDVGQELPDVFNFSVNNGDPLSVFFKHVGLQHGFKNGRPK